MKKKQKERELALKEEVVKGLENWHLWLPSIHHPRIKMWGQEGAHQRHCQLTHHSLLGRSSIIFKKL